ncbi:lysosomal acid glucosylceramidase-like [Xylocopa sonorina]|uniref:lysosomal acid glucosylceramidase-like n=1 Tax=Xylocopa sonorina TaxID=1818115 RepID=UPI00403AED9B
MWKRESYQSKKSQRHVNMCKLLIVLGKGKECVPRSFGPDRIVCVCNATYCDTTPDNEPKIPRNGTVYWYVSSKKGLRMSRSEAAFGSCEYGKSQSTVLTIDVTSKHQTIVGFGAAFTDSAGINVKKLSEATQDQLIRSYYDPRLGSRYLLGRIPIGGTDFSTRAYTYDDHANDLSLERFALAPEDYDYKIPYIKKAIELNPEVRWLSAAWSSPAWMKTNDKINGHGLLKEEYYQIYSDYIVKFLEEYKKNGIDIWAVSTGNEPLNAYVPFDRINTMGWTPKSMGKWVADNFGPTLAASRHNETRILALDDQRIELPWAIKDMFRNEKARNYTAGIAVHWYTDSFIPPTVLDRTHADFPDKFILLTEACTGSNELKFKKVLLGSWERGEKYILSIIEYMNHWAVGWMDWNIALDKEGGPNWISNFVDSPIIVNPETDEFYKQPMYYALKHFSRFVDRGSVRISITDTDTVKATAFVTPANEVVAVLYNKNEEPTNVILNDATNNNRGSSICLELPAYSMNTVTYARYL